MDFKATLISLHTHSSRVPGAPLGYVAEFKSAGTGEKTSFTIQQDEVAALAKFLGREVTLSLDTEQEVS